MNPALLPELSTFKEIQLKVVEDNPFIKNHRCSEWRLSQEVQNGRVSARTFQGQDKLISAKFKKQNKS
jgi:hypothetical protein